MEHNENKVAQEQEVEALAAIFAVRSAIFLAFFFKKKFLFYICH